MRVNRTLHWNKLITRMLESGLLSLFFYSLFSWPASHIKSILLAFPLAFHSTTSFFLTQSINSTMAVRPSLPQSNCNSRISRKITINADAIHINVRPVIKGEQTMRAHHVIYCVLSSHLLFFLTPPFSPILGAMNEAAHTLADAYANNPLLSWILQPIKDDNKKHDVQHTLFKAAVNAASLQSRDFAIQVDGCKGVCVWSTSEQHLSFAKVLGWKLTKIANLGVAMVSVIIVSAVVILV